MRVRLAATVLVLGGLVGSATVALAQPPRKPGTIAGTVTAADTGKPLRGARVTFRAVSGAAGP